jgi:hypothetical protein
MTVRALADSHEDSNPTVRNQRTIINVGLCLRGEHSKTNQVSMTLA